VYMKINIFEYLMLAESDTNIFQSCAAGVASGAIAATFTLVVHLRAFCSTVRLDSMVLI